MQPAKERISRASGARRAPRLRRDSIDAAAALFSEARMAVAVYEAPGRCRSLSTEMASVMGDEIAVSRPLWDVIPWKAAGVVRDVASTLVDGMPRSRGFVLPGGEPATATVHRVRGTHVIVLVLRGVSQPQAPADELRAFAEATSRRVAGGLVQAKCALEMLIEELGDSPSETMLAREALDSVRRVSDGVEEACPSSGSRDG
jgi:hypothetical protein